MKIQVTYTETDDNGKVVDQGFLDPSDFSLVSIDDASVNGDEYIAEATPALEDHLIKNLKIRAWKNPDMYSFHSEPLFNPLFNTSITYRVMVVFLGAIIAE